MKALVTGVATVLLAGGCVTQKSAMRTAPLPRAAITSIRPEATAPADTPPWWSQLGDPELDAFVVQALGHNDDLRLAGERILEARALAKSIRSGRRPHLDVHVSYLELDGDLPPSLAATDLGAQAWEALAEVSWEMDLFGGLQAEADRAQAMVVVADESESDLRLAVAAEVVATWLELAGTAEQTRIWRKQLAVLGAQKDDAEAMLDAGIGTPVELDRAKARLAELSRQGPILELALATGRKRLALLTGSPVGAALPIAPDRLPSVLPIPANGPAARFLARRPDLRKLERQIKAAVSATQAAEAAFLPRFFIAGGPVSSAGEAVDLFGNDETIWMLRPQASWSLMKGGQRQAELAAEESRVRQARIAYERAVREATREVAFGLAELTTRGRELLAARSTVSALASSTDRLEKKHRTGTVDQFEWLAEQEKLFKAERLEVDIRTRLAEAWVRLHRAMGGGW